MCKCFISFLCGGGGGGRGGEVWEGCGGMGMIFNSWMELFRKGRIDIIAKFHRTDLVI